jgi:hypothetical protein
MVSALEVLAGGDTIQNKPGMEGSISILDTIAKVKMSLWLWDYLFSKNKDFNSCLGKAVMRF